MNVQPKKINIILNYPPKYSRKPLQNTNLCFTRPSAHIAKSFPTSNWFNIPNEFFPPAKRIFFRANIARRLELTAIDNWQCCLAARKNLFDRRRENVEQKSINRFERVSGFCAARCIFMKIGRTQKAVCAHENLHTWGKPRKGKQTEWWCTFFQPASFSFSFTAIINCCGCDAKKEFRTLITQKTNSFERK